MKQNKTHAFSSALALGLFLSAGAAMAGNCPTDHCNNHGQAVGETCDTLAKLLGKKRAEVQAPFAFGNSSCFCGCSCYADGATVSTTAGELPVEEITPEMELRTPAGPVKINAALYSEVKNADALVLDFSNGQTVTVSSNHPFIKEGGIVTEAKDLRVGSLVLGEAGNSLAVTSVEAKSYSGKLHNFISAGNRSNGEDRILFSAGVQTADWRVQSFKDRMAGNIALRDVVSQMKD